MQQEFESQTTLQADNFNVQILIPFMIQEPTKGNRLRSLLSAKSHSREKRRVGNHMFDLEEMH